MKVLEENNKILLEAKMRELLNLTRTQTPKLYNRSDFITPRYLGISKFGILNFQTNSQTHNDEGAKWYQTVEIVDMLAKLDENEPVTSDVVKDLFNNSDLKIYCDCLAGDMEVLMADGTYKKIKDVEEGDLVITHKGNTKLVRGKSIRPSFDDLLEIDLGDRKIKCTENHQFLVNKNGKHKWVYAKDLTPDMELLELNDL